ncbi:SOS response-associated peptidase family protein [Dyadobacter sp. CY326]|uniref:SOS response-associated peptidase family protein n=1 Tax=Dyadobacter sp. CY326 TaxID=2907300 RepID=UPI0038D4B382
MYHNELFERSSYCPYWQNRCVVIFTGFFEPHYLDLNSKEHESWYIKPKNKKYFVLGGICIEWNRIKTLKYCHD